MKSNRGWNKCDYCGRFISPREVGCSRYFVPDSEITYEDAGIRCKKCTDKFGTIPPSQGCDPKYCSWVQKAETVYIISRFQEGISLNPKEYVLEDNGSLKLFPSERATKQFLLDAGYEEEDIGESVFIDEMEIDETSIDLGKIDSDLFGNVNN
jgi:hypothetical protein